MYNTNETNIYINFNCYPDSWLSVKKELCSSLQRQMFSFNLCACYLCEHSRHNILYLHVLPRAAITVLSDVMPHIGLRIRKTTETIVVEHHQSTQSTHVS